MKIKTKYLLIFLLLPVAACEKDEGPFIINNNSNPADTTVTIDTVDTTDSLVIKEISFSNDIQSIFNTRCISCHNKNHYLNLEQCCSHQILWEEMYIDTAVPSESYLYLQIKLPDPAMPYNSPPLSEQEVNTILKWIEQGAKNN